MKSLIFYVFLFMFSVQVVWAQATEDFNISVLVGSDTEPPTTPTLLTADPVAPTQVDITWSPSTDNFAVTGYSILRDGVPIATTTLLSYSDTGLTASTTYSFAVRAFDGVLNYSTTSNILSTTTPDNPAPPPLTLTGSEDSGTVVKVAVEELLVEEGLSTTTIVLTTAHPAQIEVRWGKTSSHELGYLISDSYTKTHIVHLVDLEPGTTYKYQILGSTLRGNEMLVKNGLFVTSDLGVFTLPVNVNRFLATRNGVDVNLEWQLPQVESISKVRVVRSHLGFPAHPNGGVVVYQGLRESVVDVGILGQYSPVYYTAFVYDEHGNVSSGAIAIVSAESDKGEEIMFERVSEATSSINYKKFEVGMRMPELSDITISQENNGYTMLDSNIVLDSKQSALISVPRESIAGNLKTIILTLVDPTDNNKTYSYLLRINRDQTFYETTIPAFDVEGSSYMVLEIYDYEAFVVGTYSAPLTFSDMPEITVFSSGISKDSPETVIFPDVLYKNIPVIFLFLIFLLILITVIFYISRNQLSVR